MPLKSSFVAINSAHLISNLFFFLPFEVAEDSKEIGQKLNPDSVQGGGTESEIKSFEMRKPPINAEKSKLSLKS